jgi:CRISP-associated protein Cas1
VDYKRGGPRPTDLGPEAWPADRVQVGSQALVLREHGYRVDEAVVYYHETRQRVRVPVDESLVTETRAALDGARALAAGGRIPPPLVDSPKCPRCSLVGICLPDETRRAMLFREEVDVEATQPTLFDDEGDEEGSLFDVGRDGLDRDVRRLVPARDDLRPLYVTGYALTIGKSDELLEIRDKGKRVQEVRIGEISQVNAFGQVTVTGAAVHALCQARKPVAHFSFGGWFSGLTQGLGLKNVFLRVAQFRRADDERFCLRLARDIVASKIRNQRVLLQRNHVEPPRFVLDRLRSLADRVAQADALDELLGVEGTAARLYFEQFGGMIKADDDDEDAWANFDFSARNRRPPRDPVNALLSFAYSLLVKDLTVVCHAIGLDPFVGFYHQPRFGRPALALDLMEGFRPLVADSAVLTAINTRMVTPKDFIRAGRAVTMTASGRKGLIRAYEQRMDQLVTHPLFGYRVNYRRVLEIQARLLARVLTGEIGSYPGFETR